MSEVRLASFRAAMAAIDAEREARRLSVPALASMAGSTDTSLYAWRANRRAPSLDSVIKLARALEFEIVMRPVGAKPEPDAPRTYSATVMELRKPVTVRGRRVDRLVFRPLQGSDLRVLAKHQESAEAEMRVAVRLATGEPDAVVSALDREDFARASEIIELRVFGAEVR